MNKKSVFSVCLFFPCISFGVRIRNNDIAIEKKEDMNRIYRMIQPMIGSGRFNETARILSEAYSEYESYPTRKRNSNTQEVPYWAYLDNAIKCCRKYKSRRFREMVVDSIRLAFPGIVQTD
ncbi:MAG: hypothetical protein LBF34_00075 [Puniceicoccales bacterium]|jgi:hypothetical protein|nr:hypothetical protein [Puniceicoccales bacterium]